MFFLINQYDEQTKCLFRILQISKHVLKSEIGKIPVAGLTKFLFRNSYVNIKKLLLILIGALETLHFLCKKNYLRIDFLIFLGPKYNINSFVAVTVFRDCLFLPISGKTVNDLF